MNNKWVKVTWQGQQSSWVTQGWWFRETSLSLSPRSPFSSLVVTSGLGHGAQCSSIDLASRSAAQPLNLLEKRCKLWGKGSLLTWLTLWVSTAACTGAEEPCRPCFLCEGLWSADLSQIIWWELREWRIRRTLGERVRQKRKKNANLQLPMLSSISTCPPETSSPYPPQLCSVCLALCGTFIRMALCFWETLNTPQTQGASWESHIFFCLKDKWTPNSRQAAFLSSSLVYHRLPLPSLPCVPAR